MPTAPALRVRSRSGTGPWSRSPAWPDLRGSRRGFRRARRPNAQPRSASPGEQVVLLVDEKALRIGDEVIAELRETPLDPPRGAPGDQRGSVDPRVERGRACTSTAGTSWNQSRSPSPSASGSNVRSLSGLRKGVLARPSETSRSTSRARGWAHPRRGGPQRDSLGGRVLDGHDFDLVMRSQAIPDVVRDHVRVAVHRFVHDECSHGFRLTARCRGRKGRRSPGTLCPGDWERLA